MAKYKTKFDVCLIYLLSCFSDPATFFEFFNSKEKTKSEQPYKLMQPFLDYAYTRLLNPHRTISGSRNVQKTTLLQNETLQDGLTRIDERTVYVVPAEKHMLEVAYDMEKKFEKYPLLMMFFEKFNKKMRTFEFKTGHIVEFRIVGHDYSGEDTAIAQHSHKIVVDESQLITKEYLQQLTAGAQAGFEYLIAGVSNNLRTTALWYGVSDKMFAYLRYGMYEGPNWSDDMEKMMLEQTGGKETEGWKTLVDGMWGERAYNVFPLGKLFDARETFAKNKHVYVKQTFHSMGSEEVINLLNLPTKDGRFINYMLGIDVGGNSMNSPSEIEVWGNKERKGKICGVLVYKLSLFNIGTVIQSEIVSFIASYYDAVKIGIDAQAVGSDLYRNLTEGKIIVDSIKTNKYKEICKPFVMTATVTIEKVLNKHTGKEEELKQPIKMKATTLLQDMIREGLLELPSDTEILESFQAETWQPNRQRIGGITYLNDKNEHLIDAARMYAMCLWENTLVEEKTVVRTIPRPIIRGIKI